MKKMKSFGMAIIAAGLFLADTASAHTPLCSCIDNRDGSITCEGGFSDGSAAAGVEVRVEDRNGKVLVRGKMDKFGEFSFKKPTVPYLFVFDAGPGHVVKVHEKDITE